MRFTNKDGTICYWWHKRNEPEEIHKQELANQKLSQLEDIEEELGIDLIILFKALTQGIYIKPTNIYVGSPYLCFAENENRELEFQFKVVDTWYKVKDYGKTWALTKEELLCQK